MRSQAGHLADALAQELLSGYRLGCLPRVQIDPWMLAHGLGVTVLESEHLEEDGCVRWVDGCPIVLLACGPPLERRRFTLAHELGHVLLNTDHLKSATLVATRGAFHSEETLCDALAGSLLMPHSWVSRSFRRAPHKLHAIYKLAQVAGVSLSAAVVRLREVHHWRRTLLQWRAERGGWTYEAEAGVWPSEQGIIKPCEGTSWALSAKRGPTRDACRIDLPLRIDGDERDVPAEVRFTSQSALVLIDSPARLLAR